MAKLSIASCAVACFIVIAPVAAQEQPAQLPEGEGKALVQGMCTSCHETNQITRSSGYSREGWREVIQTMVNVSGTPAGETITS
jgi:virginiamycin B lyase